MLIPLSAAGTPVEKQIVEGPVALQMEEVWKLLGFNGPAVQVQDDQGRPIAIGRDDLLAGLEKHWTEDSKDLNRGRMFAQKLMEFELFERAEGVLSKIVASGGGGEDWLGLGIAQLAQKKFDKADGTLRGAQNLMKTNPYPSLHLAKLFAEKKDRKAEREAVDRAIQIDQNSVDAWAYLTNHLREGEDSKTDAAIKEVEELAAAPVHAKIAAPYIALQGFFAGEEATRDRAIAFAKKAVERSPEDPLGLLCLSALYGQANKLEDVVKTLAPHEAKMLQNVALANNYFQALAGMNDLNRIMALLNKLATSPTRRPSAG